MKAVEIYERFPTEHYELNADISSRAVMEWRILNSSVVSDIGGVIHAQVSR